MILSTNEWILIIATVIISTLSMLLSIKKGR